MSTARRGGARLSSLMKFSSLFLFGLLGVSAMEGLERKERVGDIGGMRIWPQLKGSLI